MAAKVKIKAKPKAKSKVAPQEAVLPQQGPPPTSLTVEERLAQIELLGKRVVEQVRFVATVVKMPGTSAEARQKTVAQFHERLFASEQALEKILDELRLG
jgi:hypothetical protein